MSFGGGFGQGGFGQPAAASGGFGQGGFGQAASSSFGQPTAQGGFGQAAAPAGGFGQPAQGGFGQQAGTAGGFGQQTGQGGFGQPAGQTGFGQAASGGFGMAAGAQTGFGQQASATGTFGKPGGFGAGNPVGGFGQQPPSTGGFGQPQQTQAGGFGGTTGGFGQSAASGGFGAGAFGKPASAGGFGQPAAPSGFGQQPQAGGFGQSGFGKPAPAAGGFGQAAGAGGFGQTAGAGAFGQAAGAGGFGQTAGTGGFGQTAGAGGFGQAAGAGGFGQTAGAGGFGQAAGAGGFGQAAGAGTFGKPATGFGQPAAAAGSFGKTAATGGFGQAATAGGFGQSAAGAFGKPATGGGFGQPATAGGFGQPTAPGFGQAAGAGSFGKPAATGGFGQPTTTGGFGQPAATGGFGKPAATGGFGQPTTTGGFGQPAATGGFGQPAATGGFGQPAATGGFGQPAATGGFGQPAATGGFGQPATTGGFGKPATGGFGQPAAGGSFGTSGFGASSGAAGQSTNAVQPAQATPASFAEMPDFSEKPYGNILLFLPSEVAKSEVVRPSMAPAASTGPVPLSYKYNRNLKLTHGPTICNAGIPAIKQQAASIPVSGLPVASLRELITSPGLQLGVEADGRSLTAPGLAAGLPMTEGVDAGLAADIPCCTSDRYVLRPSLEELKAMDPEQLRQVSGFCVSLTSGRVEVHFLQPVSLLACNIADVVEISDDGRVDLYPNTIHPPPLGKGINVRARVTVHVDEAASGTDSNRLGVEETLKRRCLRDGNSFESYDGAKGVWTYIINGSEDAPAYPGPVAQLPEEEPGGDRVSDGSEVQSNYDADEEIHTPRDQTAPLRRNTGTSPGHEERMHMPEAAIAEPPFPGAMELYRGSERIHYQAPLSSLLAVSAGVPLVLPNRQSKGHAGTAAAAPLPTRTSGVVPVTKRHQERTDFTLPYDLPVATTGPAEKKSLPMMLAERPDTSVAAPVLLIRKEQSRTFAASAAPLSVNSLCALGRGFRVGWGPGGRLVMPLFSQLEDAATEERVVPEVPGARISITRPCLRPMQTTGGSLIRHCVVELLRAVAKYVSVKPASADHVPLASVDMARRDGSSDLSEEKIVTVVNVIQKQVGSTTAQAVLTPVAKDMCRQWLTLLQLAGAMYSLPDADVADSNPVAEQNYLNQLRRRNLCRWLNDEVTWTTSVGAEEPCAPTGPYEAILAQLLSHKVKGAKASLLQSGEVELARIAQLCGDGNQFGSFIQMVDAQGGTESSGVRARVLSLLSGVVEPFIQEPRYSQPQAGLGFRGGKITVNPTTATWKQLLGVFTFYGCSPDMTAEQVLAAFVARARSPTAQREGSLPPYAASMGTAFVNSARGRDVLSRGTQFEDAALLVLEAFSRHAAPAPSALHPHCSTYYGTDYLAPFLLLIMFRSLGVERSESYRIAEIQALHGFAAQLDGDDHLWVWALLPLHMIENNEHRTHAVNMFLQRNAERFASCEEGNASSSLRSDNSRLTKLLSVSSKLAQPIVHEEKGPSKALANAPSLATHAALIAALENFRIPFRRERGTPQVAS